VAGRITLDRSHFFEGPFSKEDRAYSLFEAHVDLYQRAAHSPHTQLVRGKLVHLKIGEQTASERFLEKRWSWSRTKVRSFLEMLQKNHELDHRKDQGETIRILLKYRDLTGLPKKKEPQNIPPTIPEKDQKRTSDQTSEEPKEKEGNELNEGKEGKGEDKGTFALTAQTPTLKPKHQDIADCWNSHNILPRCKTLSKSRRGAITARLRDSWWVENYQAAIARCAESNFCTGDNNRSWTASIDWFLKPDTALHLIEGKYDNRNGNQTTYQDDKF
jgi:hypothetical protein